jgi:hypothetical protein
LIVVNVDYPTLSRLQSWTNNERSCRPNIRGLSGVSPSTGRVALCDLGKLTDGIVHVEMRQFDLLTSLKGKRGWIIRWWGRSTTEQHVNYLRHFEASEGARRGFPRGGRCFRVRHTAFCKHRNGASRR